MSTTLATITTLADDRRRTTSSAVIDWTGNGFRAVNGALQLWNQLHDWPWQVETVNFTYNEGVTWYPILSTYNFKAILDIRPFKTAEKNRNLYYVMNNAFDSDFIHPYKFAIQTTTQANYLRVKYAGNMTSLNQATNITANGTWVGASGITNVANDLYNSYDLQASIKFDYSGTAGTLTNSTMTAIDATQFVANSTIFFNMFLQSVTSFTSITVKFGTDASNYITGTITTDYLGGIPVVGWNKFKLVWNGSTTTVGTLTTTSMGYIQITINYSVNPSTISNNIENFFLSQDVPMVLQYYSNNMVISAGLSGTKSQVFQTASNTSDTALWTGQWDFVNETFINSLMEIVTWLNGDNDDRDIAVERITAFLKPLQARLPSRRRYAEVGFSADLNMTDGYPRAYGFNRYQGYYGY